jgi:tRNA (guanosine-2'-O-)-methyltransferase
VACAVSLYEAYRQKMLAGHYRQRRLDDIRFHNLLNEWGDKGDDVQDKTE